MGGVLQRSDFIPQEFLWIDCCHNPSWVKHTLDKTEPADKEIHKAFSDQDRLNSEDHGFVEDCGKNSFRSGVCVNSSKSQGLLENRDTEMLSLEEALASLEQMSQHPSVENLTCILYKCRKKKNLAYVHRLYACMCKSGLETHRSLGNYLLQMLVEVGNMSDAQHVFNRLVDRNEYSWTSLIAGYIECGESHRALNLYQKMQEDCVEPSGYTFVALLKACSRLKDAKRGQQIHAEVARKGLAIDIFVSNTLVNMYAKCGLLVKAREVFDKLPIRDVVSWTALISAYAEHGFGKEALASFEQMQLEGVSPYAVTFVCTLKACGSIGALDKGQEIHAEIFKKGLLERDPIVGNALVDMYAKCGLLAKAWEVLHNLPVRNVVSWTTLISGFAEHGHGEEALNCFEHMKLQGVSPDALAFVCCLKACGSIGAVDKGQKIHADAVRKGLLEKDPRIGNALVHMYAKCGMLAKAWEVFVKLHVRDSVAWNALITGYAKQGLGEEALNCFEQMQLEGFSPDAVTFVCSLKACGSIGSIDKGRAIHAEIARNGLERDLLVGSTLVDMYAKCGSPVEAQEAFDKLSVQNVVSWTALIVGYAEQGLAEEALKCFKQMQMDGVSPNGVAFVCSLKACSSTGALDKGREIHAEIARKGLLESDPFVGNALVDMYGKCGLLAKAQEVFDKLPVRDVVSWSALITAYSEHGLGEVALNCFAQMQLEGVSPNAVTFVCCLKACGSIGAIDKGQEIHGEIARKGLEQDLFVGSTLIDMYAKFGSPAKAQEVFDRLPVRNVVSWTALIAGYARLGESENVFQMLERMRGEGIHPGAVTFLSILTVCSHTGLVDKGQKYFEVMGNNYGISPTIEHHSCMVDLLGRAGRLDEALMMMNKMPCHPNPVVCHTVLGACQKWGNVKLGKPAFELAVQLDQKDAAAYVSMSNLYVVALIQDDEKTMNAIRVKGQASKRLGQLLG